MSMVDLPKNGMTPLAPEMEPVTICYLRDTLVRSIFQARGKRSPTPTKGPASSSQIWFNNQPLPSPIRATSGTDSYIQIAGIAGASSYTETHPHLVTNRARRWTSLLHCFHRRLIVNFPLKSPLLWHVPAQKGNPKKHVLGLRGSFTGKHQPLGIFKASSKGQPKVSARHRGPKTKPRSWLQGMRWSSIVLLVYIYTYTYTHTCTYVYTYIYIYKIQNTKYI